MLLHYRVFEVLGIGGGALGLGALQMLAVIHSVEISSLFVDKDNLLTRRPVVEAVVLLLALTQGLTLYTVCNEYIYGRTSSHYQATWALALLLLTLYGPTRLILVDEVSKIAR